MSVEHILVMRFSAMGDVAMTVPVVYSLAKQYPSVKITVLSREFARAFYENLAPNIDFVGTDLKGEYNGFKGLNKLYDKLSRLHITSVADLHDVLRTKYLRIRFILGGYQVAHINKHRHEKRQLISAKHKSFKQLATSFQNYADVFARLGYPIKLDFSSIYTTENDCNIQLPHEIEAVCAKHNPLIGIAPFAAHHGKIYPSDLMEKVIELIAGKYPDCKIFLFGGGAAEADIMDNWATSHCQVINASKQLGSLSEELKLMSRLNVMVSMDSANMHLASLVGTPVVSIWGATHPYAGFLGWNQSADNVIQVDLPCRPCSIYGNKPCQRGDYACLQEIEPEAIAHRIFEVIGKE